MKDQILVDICLVAASPAQFDTLLLKHFQELTRNYSLRIERFEGVVHKHPAGRGLIPSQFVLHHQRVVAVVDVGGLIEEETAVLHRAVTCVGDELRVRVGVLLQFFAVVQPGDTWLRIAIHSEGEAPVVLLHSVPEEEDFHWNCWERGVKKEKQL